MELLGGDSTHPASTFFLALRSCFRTVSTSKWCCYAYWATSSCVFLSVDAGCSALEFDDRNEGCTAGDISAGKTRWYKCMKSACVAEAFVGVTGGLFSELERLFARVCTFVEGNL